MSSQRVSWSLGLAGFFLLITGFDIQQDLPWPSGNPAEDGVNRYTGVIHVHSKYSDGSGSIEDIADAADKALLDFVILTDHSTMQSSLDGKAGYYENTLVIIGEEVNTSVGHLLALGVGRHVEQDGQEGLPALMDTVRSSGGMNIIAHPFGRRPWEDWSLEAIDGLEILNADSEWRNDNPWEWFRAMLWYPLFPQAALNSLVDRPEQSLNQLDELSRRGHAVAIGSADAHARIPLWGDGLVPFPSYNTMFGWLRTYVNTGTPLTGDVASDTEIILKAIQEGRCYTVVEGYGPSTNFSFKYVSTDTTVSMGGRTRFDTAGALHVSVRLAGDVTIGLFKNGRPETEVNAQEAQFPVEGPGVFRVEISQARCYLPSFEEKPRPWIFSNPIWVE